MIIDGGSYFSGAGAGALAVSIANIIFSPDPFWELSVAGIVVGICCIAYGIHLIRARL